MLADDDPHLDAVRRFYGDRRAERSQVPLLRHVTDGLAILEVLFAEAAQGGASVAAQRAFCLHPLVQADADLAVAFSGPLARVDVDPFALTLALEYRRCANAHLSRHAPHTLDDVSLAPFPEVALMLIADKVQNRRDFERHHATTHPRAAELAAYFRRWLARLGVDEDRYRALAACLDRPA